jgi:hypothetical protein
MTTGKFPRIEATDIYFDEVHRKWHRVPPHWVGDLVASHPDFAIRSA